MESWNNHAISTAGNLTPNQLFIRGYIEQGMMPRPPAQLNPVGGNPTNQPSNHVQVPQLCFSPCSHLLRSLSMINSLRESHNCGVDIYSDVINILGQHLVTGCNQCS